MVGRRQIEMIEKKLRKFILENKIRPEVIAADSGLSFSTVRNFLAGNTKRSRPRSASSRRRRGTKKRLKNESN